MEISSTAENHTIYNNFEPRKYLDRFYAIEEDEEMTKESSFLLTFMKNMFSSGRVEGDSLIDIGSGPSIYNIMSACESFKQIYLTDYFEGNLQEVEKWLKGDRDAYDWSRYIKYICNIENHRSTEEEKAEKIRRKVSLMKCDITKANPLEPNSLPLVDCVITGACLSCVSKNAKDFKTVVKNVVSLIRPGGHLIITDYLRTSFYVVGETKLPVLSLDENTVREAVAESGCEVQEFMTFTNFDYPEEVFDCKIVFCLLARKQ